MKKKKSLLLQKNMKALKLINQRLHDWIEKEKDVPWIEEIYSKNGNPNLIIKNGGENITAYDMVNPRKVARDHMKNANLYKENISIVIGFGLGYLVKEMLNKTEKGHKILVVEPVGHMIRLALNTHDFSKAIKDTSLIILKDKDDLVFALHFLSSQGVVSDWSITINKYTQHKPEEYGKLSIAASEILNQVLCNTATIAGNAGAIIADNDIACLPYVIRHRGVNEIRDLYKDKPAILVSTGPSLAKNIHNLMGLENKAVIIAVGQALRVLLAYGITPDFICSVDFGEVNIGHFNGMMDSGVPLVTINRTYAPLLQKWQGPKFIAATPVPGFEEMATGILTNKGYVDAGGSVAHLCFGLAKALGCNPITFTGQDLALGETSHIPLADAAGEVKINEHGAIDWKVKDQRCSLYDRKSIGMGTVNFVPGYFGKPVPTNMGLASFITSFEAIISDYKKSNEDAIVLNATEGGAWIEGAKPMLLKEVIKKYHKKKIDKTKVKKLLSLADDGNELISKVIPLLQNDIDNLNKIITNSRKGMAICSGIKKLMNRPEYENLFSKEIENQFKKLFQECQKDTGPDRSPTLIFFDALLENVKGKELKTLIVLSEKNYRFSELAHGSSLLNPLVNVAIYGATRQIQMREVKGDQSIEAFLKDKENAFARMKRNVIILNAAKGAAKSLKKSYKKTLKLLKKYDETKDNSLLVNMELEPINLDDAETYFEAGNWAHPLLDASKIIKNNQRDREANVILKDALEERAKTVNKARKREEKESENESKLLRYNELISESRKAGTEERFKEALDLLRKAVKLLPEETAAQWGLASALHHLKLYRQSLVKYQRLVKRFPENHRFRFEYGQVLLVSQNIDEGIKEIKKVMSQTEEFDSFLSRLGEIYEQAKMFDDAIIAYTSYLKKFPHDHVIWKRKGDCYRKENKPKKAKICYKQAKKISGLGIKI